MAGRELTEYREYWFSIARRLEMPPSADLEPNDDAAAASPIAGGFELSGDLGGSPDVYRWTITPVDSERSWRLEGGTSLQAHLQLELRSLAGEQTAAAGLDLGGLARIHDLRLPAGEYLVVVAPPAEQAQPYVLRGVGFSDPLADPDPTAAVSAPCRWTPRLSPPSAGSPATRIGTSGRSRWTRRWRPRSWTSS